MQVLRKSSSLYINGEAFTVSQRYSTFDKAEMDRLEDYLKSSMGCGVSVEYDIDKCIENEKEANDVVLQRIKDEIKTEMEEHRDIDDFSKGVGYGLRRAIGIIERRAHDL